MILESAYFLVVSAEKFKNLGFLDRL